MSAHPTIVVLAGEPSGDHHGAAVVTALRESYPQARFIGMGGPAMKAAGVDLLAELDTLAVMGFVEVLPRVPYFLGLERRVVTMLGETRADLVILIDYPGFNMRVARAAHLRGHKVLYYIAPQVWAWRTGRARKLADSTDGVAVILPFEEEFLAKHGVDATYVGHPLLDRTPSVASREHFHDEHGLDESRPVLAVLPGSRVQELDKHLELFADAARRVTRARPEVQVVFSRAESIDPTTFRGLGFPYVEDTTGLLHHARAGLVKSGTSTLEAALADLPHVVAYRTSPLTGAIALRVIQTEHISLPNLIAGREVVPEFIQDVRPAALAKALLPLLAEESGVRSTMLAGLAEVRSRLGTPGAAGRVAALAREILLGATP